MLVSVGMYLPLETTFAIFLGGLIKGIVEMLAAKRGLNDAQKVRVENNGVLLAAGSATSVSKLGRVLDPACSLLFLDEIQGAPAALL